MSKCYQLNNWCTCHFGAELIYIVFYMFERVVLITLDWKYYNHLPIKRQRCRGHFVASATWDGKHSKEATKYNGAQYQSGFMQHRRVHPTRHHRPSKPHHLQIMSSCLNQIRKKCMAAWSRWFQLIVWCDLLRVGKNCWDGLKTSTSGMLRWVIARMSKIKSERWQMTVYKMWWSLPTLIIQSVSCMFQIVSERRGTIGSHFSMPNDK